MAECGTRTSYAVDGCRCELCRTAQRDYMRRYKGSPIDVPYATNKKPYLRAVQRLAERHAVEFARLLEDEQAREMTA